jgi:ATP-dependent Clp protease ATP-binding subunit ClpC
MVRVFLEAEDISQRAAQPISSAHVLLAIFTFQNKAQQLLSERSINEDTVLSEIRVVEDEPQRTVTRLREKAREIARGSGSKEVDCLHLLIAITRLRDSFAYRLLDRTGTSITSLRNLAVSYVTGNMPRRFRTLPKVSTNETMVRRRTQVAAPQVEELPAPMPAPLPTPSFEIADEFDDLSEAVDAAMEMDDHSPAYERVLPSPKPEPGQRINVEEFAPTLASCGIDLTEQARQGRLDVAIGRERELDAVVDVLGKRRANNPVLVGPPGVGKTAIVEGLAVLLHRGSEEIAHLADRTIFALDTGALVAGTSLRGAFSERLGAIKAEVAAAEGRIIVFIDELHTLIGAGNSGEGSQDAANELKAALARGEFPCVGATTFDEFKKHIEKDPALERRFSPVVVEEPSPDEAILILEGGIGAYSEHHQVSYSLDAVHAAVNLSHRFITERQLPDKAFAVADLAGSRARRRGAEQVERMDIARVIHEWSSVPLERLAEADTDRFNRAERIIAEKLIGHNHVVESVANAIRRGFAGFNHQRPIGSFLFLGPTGVGNTELVKILAEFLFGRRDAIVRMDMSEFSEPHSVSRLVGAQPGYVGYEEGGQLTEALRRRPFQIVLFDEIEKAHKDVLNILLQILDEGHLTDSRGRKISFRNTLVVLTSNLGAVTAGKGGIGFSGGDEKASESDRVLGNAREQMAPELWGRLDEKLVFHGLSREEVYDIASLQLEQTRQTLFAEREVNLTWGPEVIDFLMARGGYTPSTGARGMRQAIQRFIEGPVAQEILGGSITTGSTAHIEIDDSESLEVRALAV